MIKVDKISTLRSAYHFAQPFWHFVCVNFNSVSPHHSIPVEWMGADALSVLSLCGGFPFPRQPHLAQGAGPTRRQTQGGAFTGPFRPLQDVGPTLDWPLSPPWDSQFPRASCPKLGGETHVCEGLLPCKPRVRPKHTAGFASSNLLVCTTLHRCCSAPGLQRAFFMDVLLKKKTCRVH